MVAVSHAPIGRWRYNVRFLLVAALGLAAAASPAMALPPVNTPLTALSITANTGEKPQSKVWTHDGRWWCVLPNSSGTWIWRLDGTTWTSVYQLSTSTSVKADVKSTGSAVHVLLYNGTSSALASAEYVTSTQTYQAWTPRPGNVAITLDSGVETATLDIDSQGRMWLASDETDEIMVRYSDSPYSSWSAPFSLVTGINSDDICAVTALPNGTIGVLWSNQTTQRFGFRAHVDGASPTVWSADEVPASQSALNVGLGMGDDHLNFAVASDATLYAAVKTSYDTGGFVKIALLVRRPSGTWDNLYEVDQAGTRGICLLNEGTGTVSVIYTSVEGSGDIVYKESPISTIAFPPARSTLMSGAFNEVTSTRQNVAGSVVILASTTSGPLQAVGVLRSSSDVSPPSVTLTAPNGGQVWTVGTSQNITWTASDDIGVTAVDLEYSTNGGSSWTPIVSSLANTGTYAWSVPNAPTTQARVRATAHDAATNQAQDASDANFTIQAVPITHTITASAGPNGAIAPVGAVVVNDGANAPFNITPDSGYHVADVLVDGGSVGAVTTYTFMNVTADHTIAASFAVNVPAGDLVGWWKMDGNVTDASGFANHAAAFGGPTFVTGVLNQALNLNGTSQYAAAPDHASLDVTNALTLATWVKPTLEATQNLISKSTNGGVGGFELCLAATSSAFPHKAFFRLNQVPSGDTYRVNSTTLYSDHLNTWIHLAATYDGATMKLYVNGALESSLPAAITVNSNALPLGLGAQVDAGNAGTRFFAGAMDDSRVYNRALTAGEIAALAAATTHTITASAGTGGSIVPSGAVVVSDGASQAFTITPASCHTIADVLVDGLSVGAVAGYTFTNVTADHTIAASFAATPPYTVTASAGPNGSISPSGAVPVACGASQLFTISPSGGYHVADVLVDGGSVGAVTSYTLTNVQAPHTIAASFAPDVPVPDLVGRWRMDEGSGTLVADDSPNGLDGTAAGSPTWVPGVQGPWALSFTNGTSQYVSVPDATPLDITSAITLAAWIRPTQVATASILNKATFASGPVFGYELNLSTTGVPFVRLFNDTQAPGGGRLNGTVPYPTNGTTWMHVAATYDGAMIKMYVNGVLDVTRASTASITTNNLPFVIGAPSDGLAARVFPGAIDDARLYNRALTAGEIAALANLTPTYTITASAGTGGSINPSGAVVVNQGADQTFMFTPATNYHVSSVTVDAIPVAVAPSYTFTNVTANHTIGVQFALDTYTLTYTAGPNGTISGTSPQTVSHGGSGTEVTAVANAGYQFVSWSDGVLTAARTETNVMADLTVTASFAIIPPDQIAAAPAPGSAISNPTSCVSVPVVFTRADATPIRAYSVTVELSPNLSLCGGQFASAGYTQPPRQFLVTSLGGNQWTVDDATLGSPCGASGSGTLFTLEVTSAETSGTGTITVLSATVRDCLNQSVPASPGAPASVTIDRVGPAQTLDLVAIQSKTGNYVPPPLPSHATTPVRLEFTLPGDAVSVELYRRPFGGYPQYDENGGAEPVPPAALPGAGWTLTAITAPGQSDEPASRDFWYYALVTHDAHGNASAVSNLTAGTLNYYLGDWSNGLEACAGDDRVNSADVSLLGTYYGLSLPVNDAVECLDVGPTTDQTADGRPLTDNLIGFEDLAILALGYGVVSAPQPGPARALDPTGRVDRLTLASPRHVAAGAVFEVRIDLRAGGGLHALSVALDWSRSVAEPLAIRSGDFFESAGGVTFAAGPAAMDGAILGAAAPGLEGEGVFAIVRFRALADGDPMVRLARVRGRDRQNQPVAIDDFLPEPPTASPTETRLLAAAPAPFTSETTIAYSLVAGAEVELAVFGIEGRRVRTLHRGSRPAGVHRVTWDGSDDRGHSVAAGVYYVRLSAGPRRFSQLLVRLGR